jgi:hypothetical protein
VSGTTSPHTITEKIIDRITDDRCARSPAWIGACSDLLRATIRRQIRTQVERELDNLDNPQEAA